MNAGLLFIADAQQETNWLEQFPNFLKQVLDTILAYSIWAWLFAIGILFIFYSLVQKRANADNFWALQLRDSPVKWSLGLGFLLMAISQLSVFIHLQNARQLTAKESFERLSENKRVNYIIRIIAYDASTEGAKLSVGKIERLGPEDREYVFVGDYEELRNYTVLQAIYKTGIKVPRSSALRATVIIFPLSRLQLFPANARGLLQVVRNIDKNHLKDLDYRTFLFHADELNTLASDQIASNSWAAMKATFNNLKGRCDELQKGDFGAKHYISEIADDWRAEGFASVEGVEQKWLTSPTFQLDLGDTGKIAVDNYGARVFLFENRKISEIDNVILCGFSHPEQDLIPDIGGKFDDLEATSAQVKNR